MGDQTNKADQVSATDRAQSPAALAGMGFQFVAALLFFVYAGNWIDARFGSSPFALLVGVFVGAGGTFYLNYRRLMRRIEAAEQAAKRAREEQ